MILLAFNEYRRLESELYRIRGRNRGEDSAEEEGHLERMDAVWHELTEAERMQITVERSTPQTIREMREEDAFVPLVDTNSWIDVSNAQAPRAQRRLACI